LNISLLKQKNKSWCKYTLEKTKGVIKNGQSRDTGSIGHTRHAQVEGNKTQQKTQKTRKMINTNPTGGEHSCSRRVSSYCANKHKWHKYDVWHEPTYKQLEVRTNR